MGNDEGTVKENSSEETSKPKEETPNTENKPTDEPEEKTDTNNEQKNDTKPKTEEKEEKKEDVEKLRKVIKVDESKPEEKKSEDAPVDNAVLDDDSRGGLEQKRAILQSIKDFDFQIKKNQEELTAVNQKLDSVSKDLDDLVSLYEIVSEQMNPFVGLSKVTKKRIDALENFTKEVDDLKSRMGDLESFAEMAGANLDDIKANKPAPTQDSKKTGETESGETTQITPNTSALVKKDAWSNYDVDIIIEKAFGSITMDNEIDTIINEFIENLKM